jgi:hypothetical protein
MKAAFPRAASSSHLDAGNASARFVLTRGQRELPNKPPAAAVFLSRSVTRSEEAARMDVLLVEDETLVREMLHEDLTDAGLAVVQAATAE